MSRMSCWAMLLLAGASLPFSGCATVKTGDDLSAMQISALQESNERLDVYDRQLQKLDADYAKGKIRRSVYDRETRDLVALIREESEFQNAILIKDPKIKVMAQHLLETIQKVAEGMATITVLASVVALKSMASWGGAITPMITP
jgi:hypothetical protein